MKLPRKFVRLFLCAALLLSQSNFASAFETDQFNLPPAPLADIGDEVSLYAAENLEKAVDKINAEIGARLSCLENDGAKSKKLKCASPAKEREKLAALRSDEAVARAFFDLLGAGFPPDTKSGTWMEKHTFVKQPARFKTTYAKSIFFTSPINYLTISSTVSLYDAQFGTDKIAHLFQQGYTYYKIYKRALADKMSPEQAAKKAVDWGKQTERTFYGTLVSGVYSNADLCANFVGMKFYLNLTGDVKIGNETKPAVLRIENGAWKFGAGSADLRQNILKPFVSKHLNEALNPSIYIFGLRSYVRKTVKEQNCKQWRAQFPNRLQTDFDNDARALKLWNTEDYGFTDSNKFITIGNTCFDNADEKLKENRTQN